MKESSKNNISDYMEALSNFIKIASPEAKMLFAQYTNDEKQYFKDMRAKKTGYKWSMEIATLNVRSKLLVITSFTPEEANMVLDISKRTGVPLNILLTSIIHLEFTKNDINTPEFEKILINYYKFNLNIKRGFNINNTKSLLLNLPDDLSYEYEDILKECIFGRFLMLNFTDFEQVKNYDKLCEEAILYHFSVKENTVSQLRLFIEKTKFRDAKSAKRDIYFYKKYMGSHAQDSTTYTLFSNFFNTDDKETLLKSYLAINALSPEFDLDDTLSDIREQLTEISKNDIIHQMNNMQKRIKIAKTKEIDGHKVIDFTGTDFNLLISVIAGMGSPYIVRRKNKISSKQFSYKNEKKMFMSITKQLVKRRYNIDPYMHKQICTSSIDSDFLGHIRSAEADIYKRKQIDNKLIFAYFPTDKRDIFLMGNQDLMSMHEKGLRTSHKDNRDGVCNLKLDDLNNSTIGDDNEIIVDSFPGAVVCFDKISPISVETAEKINVPIIYINSREQLKIMQRKLNRYYNDINNRLSASSSISNDDFENMYNSFELNNNIIHRAFKLANSFAYIDSDEYPKEQISKSFEQMKHLVSESLKKANSEQKKIIRDAMRFEANPDNVRYAPYPQFIDLKGFYNMVISPKNDKDLER